MFLIDIIKKSEVINSKLKLNLLFPDPDNITDEDIESIIAAYNVIVNGSHTISGNGITVKHTLTPTQNDRKTVIEQLENAKEGEYVWALPNHYLTILGEKIDLGVLKSTFTNAKITLLERSKSEYLSGKRKSFVIKITGTENSQLERSKSLTLA